MNKNLYANRISHFNNELKNLKIRNRNISLFRLVIFVIALALAVLFFEKGIVIMLLIGVFFLIPFIFLVNKSVKHKYRIKFTEELININTNELAATKGDISNFESGNEFVDSSHAFSFDLDIFGKNSIYQYINRTCTGGGAYKLANALQTPLNKADLIKERQQAASELAGLLDWRQNFQAAGNISMKSDNNSSQLSVFQTNKSRYVNDDKYNKSIIKWLKSPYIYISKLWIKLFLQSLPILTSVLLILLFMGVLPVKIFILYGIFQLGFYIFQKKNIDKVDMQLSRQINILERYEHLLELIQKHDFKSKSLIENHKKLQSQQSTASKELKHLKSLVKYLDNRNNILFAILANALVQWDMQCVLRLEKWRITNQDYLPKWLDVIYEFDFLSSFANFEYNNPDFCKAEIVEKNFYLDMHEGAHPLINSTTRIANSICIDNFKQLLVVTGANMAGKSTFLRTIGVNMVLAMAGAMVCAKKFVISPIQLHTSIRVTDSVQNNESYFFAELKRLQSITDRMKAGENLFVIIDEMLRGTNSKDKHYGSMALIEQLLNYNTSGLLATHDIALGKLAEKYPLNVRNYRFEVEIANNELNFDYKLKPGISQNLNATFLMKKMGIV